MNYQDVTDYIYNLQRFGIKLGLTNITHLLELIGNPQKNYKTILVGGTSGKGSTVAMISSILQEAGFRVGTFTSPHLSSFTERIIVNKKRIPEKDVVRIINEIKPAMDEMEKDPRFQHPTFFEVTTALAFKYFSEQKVDFAVLEVGMGGRLDATNVVDSLVSVITNVYLEHTKYLGNTVKKIAREKAGIIKNNGMLITSTEDDEVFSLFKKICEEKNSRIFRVRGKIKYKIPLLGDHQLWNASAAVGAIESLKFHDITIPEGAIKNGLKNVKWPGRLEIIQRKPLVVLDCAKDPVAMRKLKEALANFKYDKLILVISISSDKDIQSMMNEIVPISDFVLITKHKVMGRGTDPKILAKKVKKHSKDFMIIEDVKDAVKKGLSLSGNKDMMLVTGSLFTVGEARELWFKEVNLGWGREFNEAP